jgi:hypothetical protein
MITLELAAALNDRCLWDDIIEPYRSMPIVLNGPALEIALAGCVMIIGKPTFILLPWNMADLLSSYEHDKFNADNHHYESAAAYREAHKNDPFVHGDLKAMTWGYMGTYLGADLLASGVIDDAWITSATEPKLIDGNNTVFLEEVK